MSNVPKLRFKEFSGEWDNKSIEDLVKYNIFNKPLDGNHGSIHPISSDFVNEGIPFLMANDIKNGQVDLINCKKIKKEQANKLQKGFSLTGDVLLTHKGSVGQTSLVPKIDTDYVMLTPQVTYYRVKNTDVFSNIFLLQNFRSQSFQKTIKMYSDSGTRPYIGITEQRKLKLSFPLKQEQEKIASFLTSVDTKIEQLTKKESLLQEYKKGVMQKIFNQEIRFKDDDGSEFCEWEKEKLGKYLVEYKVKSILENEYPVFTSSNKGLMLQSDYFGENRLTERDNIGFNVVPNNHITYRSRSDNRTFTFNMNTLGFTGVISTYYPVFESKNGDNRFIVTLLNENKHFIGRYSVGTSQTVLSFNELKNIKMFIPTPKEQTKISDFLSSIDKKIENAKDEVEKTKEFKKALLQQMFV